MAKNPWLPTSLRDDAGLRLVCLPNAGGGSAVFHRWRPVVPRQIELVPLCLPGREGRAAEPPSTDVLALVQPMADALAPLLDRPWAALGHSMGAWVAFEFVREIRRRGLRLPELLVVAACRAPHEPMPTPMLHTLPDDEFLAQLQQRFDGIPPAVRDQPELLRMMLPALRADIEWMETYRHEADHPLDLEVLAMGGADDPAVSAAQLAAWRRHTTKKISARLMPGGHFFLFRGTVRGPDDANAPVQFTPALRTIVERLMRCLGPTPQHSH